MIEIIQSARSIIPAVELTFLSLQMYLYSKVLISQSIRYWCLPITRICSVFLLNKIFMNLLQTQDEVCRSLFSHFLKIIILKIVPQLFYNSSNFRRNFKNRISRIKRTERVFSAVARIPA